MDRRRNRQPVALYQVTTKDPVSLSIGAFHPKSAGWRGSRRFAEYTCSPSAQHDGAATERKKPLRVWM